MLMARMTPMRSGWLVLVATIVASGSGNLTEIRYSHKPQEPCINANHNNLIEGLNLTLVCSMCNNATTHWALKWSVPQATFIKKRFNETYTQDKRKVMLTVSNITKNDEGKYTCHARDGFGNSIQKTYNLQLGKNVLILTYEKKNSARQGDNVELVVDILSPTPVSAKWYSASANLTAFEGEIYNCPKINCSYQTKLRLRRVTVNATGNYTLHINNSQNYEKVILNLIVEETIVETNKTSYTVDLGDPLQIEVKITPNPTSIKWSHESRFNDTHADLNEFVTNKTIRGTLTTQSTLFIPKSTYQTVGEFSILVNNQKEVRFTVDVIGKPILSFPGGNTRFSKFNETQNVTCNILLLKSNSCRRKWYKSTCETYSLPTKCGESQPLEEETREDKMKRYGQYNSSVKVLVEKPLLLTCKVSCVDDSVGNMQNVTVFPTDTKDGFSIAKMGDPLVYSQVTVFEGENLDLICSASKHHYTNNLRFKSNVSKGITYEAGETKLSFFKKLKIFNVEKHHQGTFNCFAKPRDKNETTVGITVSIKELKVPKIDSNLKTLQDRYELDDDEYIILPHNNNVGLECKNKEVGPQPNITWYENGRKVNHNETEKKVTIKGNHTCLLENRVGSDSVSFLIKFSGADVNRDSRNFGIIIILLLLAIIVVICATLTILLFAKRVQKLRREIQGLTEVGLLNFEQGNTNNLNPELDVGEQAELLPYDKKQWEFPREKLILGKQLGAGAFGVVLRAEARDLTGPGTSTTVAVKMVKRTSDYATIKALVSELKIMIHLGKHLNVINVLGACTNNILKWELLVLVEYCKYGNLQDYLRRHRKVFINQINPMTGAFEPTTSHPISPRLPSEQYRNTLSTGASTSADTSGKSVASSGLTVLVDNEVYMCSQSNSYSKEPELLSVSTQDLICWGFQIARGMEYLASRKVLHGDLAARNILLAEDNIVKIGDFGFSRNIYKNCNYLKRSEGPLPVKWMALESIRDSVFSTQSDVWSYGVTLWELFSLASTPYPGLEMNESLINKLEDGYRMELPKYATKKVYEIMKECWHANPHIRPSFTEIAEKMGGMLEETIKEHYVDLNDPFMQGNAQFLAQQDYLSMLRSPNYANWSPHDGPYITMRPILKKLEENKGSSTDQTGNKYISATEMISYNNNPNYANVGEHSQPPSFLDER